MKTFVRAGILLIVCALLITGCKPLVDEVPSEYTVYASFYPVYALSEMILDGIPGMKLRVLAQPQDGCLRLYALSDWDAYLLSVSADAVILCGGGLEAFSDALYGMGENGPAVIQACDSLVLKNGGEGEDHFSGPNPWLFLSLDGAAQMTEAICANMIALDSLYERQYLENLDAAEERLARLKSDMKTVLDECDKSVKVALAHEGLTYFADEWNLNAVAVLRRESGEMASGDELNEMLARMEEGGARHVILEKQAPAELVRAFEDAGIVVIPFDTLSTGTEALGADGYFSAMSENARRVRDGLLTLPN